MSTIKLPGPIEAFFTGKGRADAEAAVACFASDATVWDNGEDLEIKGSANIRNWLSETVGKYKLTSEVKSVVERDGGYLVGVVVTGDFPGSPYEFAYLFTLSEGEIVKLAIDPIGSVAT